MALIKAALSVERFESHRLAPDEADERVFIRDQWNAEVSECYYAPLRVLEVVLRNRFDLGVAANFRNPDWLISVPSWLGETGQEDVRKAHAYHYPRPDPARLPQIPREKSREGNTDPVLTTNASPNGSAWKSAPPNRLRRWFRGSANCRQAKDCSEAPLFALH